MVTQFHMRDSFDFPLEDTQNNTYTYLSITLSEIFFKFIAVLITDPGSHTKLSSYISVTERSIYV